MESLWGIYFKLGYEHILDIQGYDHMLFLLALCIPFTIKDWRKALILATAFTIGHSVTLALCIFDLVRFPSYLIEFLIPLTIAITAIFDIFRKKDWKIVNHYLLALFFGFIHGMGFSNFLRSSIFPGQESQLFKQLLAFNVGIEIGQVIIVMVLLCLLWLISKLLAKVQYKGWWNYQKVLGIAVVLWSIVMMVERFPE